MYLLKKSTFLINSAVIYITIEDVNELAVSIMTVT